MNFRILCFVLVAMVPTTRTESLARSTDSLVAAMDRLFAEWNTAHSPGCMVTVSKDGKIVYERGFGMANLELGVPITSASVLPVASISKPLSVLLLAKRGQLSLDDEVWKYVPEWVDREHRITIRHLLTHTSGLREAFTLIAMQL